MDAFFLLFFRARIFLPTYFGQMICFSTFRAFLSKRDALITRSLVFPATILAIHELFPVLVLVFGSVLFVLTKGIHIFFPTHGLHLRGRCLR